jgi:hypothetical protein
MKRDWSKAGSWALGAALAGALLALALAAAPAGAGLGPNQADSKKLIDEPLDRYAYDPGRRCKKGTPPGTKAMIAWLGRHTQGSLLGTYRCEKWGHGNFSLHAESRAIDWAMDVRDSKQRQQAKKLINKRFLAKDRKGRDNALARRMGIQGLIFDCQAWFGGDGDMGHYSYCYKRNGEKKHHLDPTAAHEDHIHIELSLRGAARRTSFWRSGLR